MSHQRKFLPIRRSWQLLIPAVIGQLPAGVAGDKEPLDGVVQLIRGLLWAAQYQYPRDHPSRARKVTARLVMELTGEGKL